ncbi:FIST signal transduction protein [Pseudaeromonas paramecii]|uniref:FIST N-terminal domain-containing protein n=1 Tax=Pseudaeromonas paramecii TaxID=2138166 RepID=A0ABP8PXB5_9GAMM
MKLFFSPRTDLECVAQALGQMSVEPGLRGILMLTAEGNHYDLAQLDALLQHSPIPIFGGIFPYVLYEEVQYSTGVILLGLCCPLQLAVLPQQRLQDEDISRYLPPLPRLAGEQRAMLLTFIDGFGHRIHPLIQELFNHYGLELNYIGGGCGSLSMESGPCVITPQGVLQDAAVLVLCQAASGIGVAHGWESISGAFKVTASQEGLLQGLDWMPAWTVYQEVVEQHAGVRISEENFFEIAKAYPLGIAKLGSELVIRDPVRLQGDALLCVGEVRKGAYVHVMHGGTNTIIQAARHARDMAVRELGQADAEIMLFVNCVSRSLFLGAEFHRELQAVSLPGTPMIGALTLGEIANSGRDYLEFFNKTSVVGLIKS